jgi:serine/threonine protein kinase
MEPTTDPLIETQVSEYIIKEQIGTGGMGIVYRAVQPLIGKQVAIKVLKSEFAGTSELVQRLLVEARVVNAIQHRGIIDIFGFGELPDGRPYMVMELLQGISLDVFIRKHRPISATETVGILDEILAALGAAHRAGVIHRDLKPGNVFLVQGADGARTIKLLDFGIAKMAESRLPRPLTAEGNVLGTPAFMSPEQVRGEKLTGAADLYAVGVIAFQMLTGRLPFSGDPSRVLMAQLEVAPPPLSRFVPEVPAQLESIVMRLLAKSLSQRFASAEEVRHELRAFISNPAAAPVESPPTPSKRATQSLRVKTQRKPTVSLAPRTLEMPMAAPQAEAAAPPELVAGAPRSRRPARPFVLLAVGAVALVASAGVVGSRVTPRSSAVEEQAAAPRPVNTEAAHAEPLKQKKRARPSKPSPQPSADKQAIAHSEPAKPASSEPVQAPKAEAARLAPAAVEVLSPTEQTALIARVEGIQELLSQLDPEVCSVTALAELKELQRQAGQALTEEQRMSVALGLDEWERKFFSNQ